MKLWSGRFGKETDALVNDFNASIQFDQRLYKEDITGSLAHAKMLGDCGIISQEDVTAITEGLNGILADVEAGKVEFTADSDAIIVKGIISMLIDVLSGHTPQEILDADLYFIDRIGLSEHLSPTRSNGLLAMVKQMRLYATAFKALEQK